MTLLMQGEVVVLPCAQLDTLLEQWLGDSGATEAFTNYRLFLLDESHAHPALSQVLAIDAAQRSVEQL
jgi:hypothetical protein